LIGFAPSPPISSPDGALARVVSKSARGLGSPPILTILTKNAPAPGLSRRRRSGAADRSWIHRPRLRPGVGWHRPHAWPPGCALPRRLWPPGWSDRDGPGRAPILSALPNAPCGWNSVCTVLRQHGRRTASRTRSSSFLEVGSSAVFLPYGLTLSGLCSTMHSPCDLAHSAKGGVIGLLCGESPQMQL
jgi:hypothetical protein